MGDAGDDWAITYKFMLFPATTYKVGVSSAICPKLGNAFFGGEKER